MIWKEDPSGNVGKVLIAEIPLIAEEDRTVEED